MKIAFIASCLEAGRDGVGDYTRLLAEECVEQGHECCLLSLNDHFLSQISQSEIVVDKVKILVLRLPANMPWSQRIAHSESFLALWQPDWISLQFVPYGFQAKGVVIRLSKWLRPLLQGRQLHLMFHELWLGEHVGASLKERFVGTVQKFFILRLVRQLQPAVVHTSNSAYVAMLKQLGISARRLPMFGNIPIYQTDANDWLLPKLQELGLDINQKNRRQFWLIGFFGTLHPIWPAEPLFTYLHRAGTLHQCRIAMISIGRLGSGKALWESLAQTYACQFVFLQLGEQLPAQISEFFNSIDFSIATSPYLLTGKSGTVASMLEHGLPVIVNRDDFQLSHFTPAQESEPLLYKVDCCLVSQIGRGLIRAAPQSRLVSSATQFIEELTA